MVRGRRSERGSSTAWAAIFMALVVLPLMSLAIDGTRLLYLRTLSYQKPYGTLMNMNFNQLTYNRVETYFQISLFYGIFPSMFSADASGNRYWDQPALYNRDRSLFIKYIPLIQAISQAGWQPRTSAQSSSASVYLERYDSGVGLYLAGRNMTAGTVAPTLTIFSAGAGLPANGAFSVRELIAGTRQRVDASGGQLTWTPPLPAAGAPFSFAALPCPGPAIMPLLPIRASPCFFSFLPYLYLKCINSV